MPLTWSAPVDYLRTADHGAGANVSRSYSASRVSNDTFIVVIQGDAFGVNPYSVIRYQLSDTGVTVLSNYVMPERYQHSFWHTNVVAGSVGGKWAVNVNVSPYLVRVGDGATSSLVDVLAASVAWLTPTRPGAYGSTIYSVAYVGEVLHVFASVFHDLGNSLVLATLTGGTWAYEELMFLPSGTTYPSLNEAVALVDGLTMLVVVTITTGTYSHTLIRINGAARHTYDVTEFVNSSSPFNCSFGDGQLLLGSHDQNFSVTPFVKTGQIAHYQVGPTGITFVSAVKNPVNSHSSYDPNAVTSWSPALVQVPGVLIGYGNELLEFLPTAIIGDFTDVYGSVYPSSILPVSVRLNNTSLDWVNPASRGRVFQVGSWIVNFWADYGASSSAGVHVSVWKVQLSTVSPYLKMTQRDDGLGINRHARLPMAASSQQSSRSPRLRASSYL